MTPFKYFKDKKEIWADWIRPNMHDYTNEENDFQFIKDFMAYNSRPHFPVSPELDALLANEQVIDRSEFVLDYTKDYHNPIAIPLPKEESLEAAIKRAEKDGDEFKKALPEQQDIPMDKEIRAAILGTLVIENKQSIDLAVKKILKIVSQSPKEEKES